MSLGIEIRWWVFWLWDLWVLLIWVLFFCKVVIFFFFFIPMVAICTKSQEIFDGYIVLLGFMGWVIYL